MRIALGLGVVSFVAALGVVACSSGDATSSSSSSSGSSSSSSGGSSSSSSGGSSSSSSGGSSSSSSGGSSSSSSGSSGSCNTLTQLGTSFDILTTQTAAPTAAGGTPVDGTFVATSGKVWGATSSPEGSKFGTAGAVTLKITGNVMESISTGASSGVVTRRKGTYSVSGASYTATESCVDPKPDGGLPPPTQATYDATSTKLTLYFTLGGTAVLETVYTKQ